MIKKDILIVENLAAFEKLINRDQKPYDINLMVMPGTLEDKHKDVDPEKGIRALRRKFNLVYILLSGVHDVHLGADYRWLKPNDVVIVPENYLYASSHIRQCIGYCIHFKTEFIQPLLTKPLNDEFPYFDWEAEHIVNVTDDESKVIQQSFVDIIAEYERFSPEKDYILRNYILILLFRVREIFRKHITRINEEATNATKIANRYKHLLQKNFLTMRKVEEYASMMNISPKHMTDMVKEATGRTPRGMINDILLLESKVLMGSTDKTITEISYDLQFGDQAHFGHFIKQQTGLSPKELRKKL
jgi:AraC family transcriptional regulator, transcriptional activator of pobA